MALALIAAAAPAASAASTTAVTGKVVDAHGASVANAHVSVAPEHGAPFGQGASNAEGRFAFDVKGHSHGYWTLHVEAAGFESLSRLVEPKAMRNARVDLDRHIDEAFLAGIPGITDPAERIERIEDLLTHDEWTLPRDLVFRYTGILREDLLAATQRTTRNESGSALSERAFELLAYWDDPRDQALLKPWRAQNTYFRAPYDGPVVAPDTDAMCEAWARVHFAHEGTGKSWPWYHCGAPAIDPTGTHALIEFEVRYANWYYTLWLVLWRDGKDEPWTLREFVNGVIS